jgi:signal transduction histidine kinase/CheY-like chemotaxis protein/HPt (histidine-containing phosphotransfer) domain-containing protein
MKQPNQRLLWTASLAILTVFVCVWLTAALLLRNAYNTALQEATLKNIGQAQAFAEYSSSAIKRIDEFLLDTRDQWNGDWEHFAAVVKRRQASILDLAFQVAVINDDGFLEFSNLAKQKERIDLRSREHFQIHKLTPGADKLFISSPVKGKLTGQWSIQFTRPILKNGRFDGVLVASISPSLLAAFNAKIGGDIDRSVTIINAKGVVLARHPELESALGQVIKGSPFLRPEAPVSGSYRRIGSIDNEERLFGYYKTPEYGLNFVIGATVGTVIAPYRQSRQLIIAAALTISLLLAVFWLMTYRALRALKRAQIRLEQARDHATLANISKSQFLANMSHEIRTPMNAVLGLLHLLRTTELSVKQTDYASKTEHAARSLLRLIDNILDLSKIEACKIELDLRPFRLASLIDDLAVILSANLHAKSLVLRFEIDPTIPAVLLGDDMRLQQVLINIGGNAIKFTHHGEINVSVKLIESNAKGALLEFSVRDNGIGVAPEKQASIFNNFSQADASTTRRFGGTGLGLSISSRIVALLGGELKISSTLGLGSRFYFQIRMPLAEMPATPALSQAMPQANNEPRERLAGLRLLVVEDNEINQLVAQGLLSVEGAIITLAENGQLGLDAIANQAPFDAVLMDVQMPVMDGYEATRNIRQTLGLTDLPIIAMTANAMTTDREACLKAGMNDHIGKPFDLDQLVTTLQHWTGHSGHRTAEEISDRPVLPAVNSALLTDLAASRIDVAGALARLNGNETLFASIVHSFANHLAHLPEQISLQLCSDIDPLAASREIHTLRGLAATVGADHLAQVATELELRMKNAVQVSDYAPLLAQLEQTINATLLALKPVLARYRV